MRRRESRSNRVEAKRHEKYKYANGHDPTLRTIRIVEETLKEKKFLSSKNQLYQALGRRVMQQTLSRILDYLEESNKIRYKKNSSISWIFGISGKPERKPKVPKKSKLSVKKSRNA
jgi:hypothetical protein